MASASSNENVIGGAAPNQSSNSFQPSVGMAPSSDATAVAPPANDDIVSSLTATLSSKPVEPSNTNNVSTNSESQPVEPNTPSQWVMDGQTTTSSTPVDEPIASLSATPPSSIKKFHPSANITDLRPLAKIDTAPTPPQAPTTPTEATNPSIDAVTPAQNPQTDSSTTSNEIASLDSKDEHVFSDDQFNQLANSSTERPAAVQDLTTKAATPPVVVPMDTIRPVATAVPNTDQSVATANHVTPQAIQTPQPIAEQPVAPVQPTLNPNAINTAAASTSTITPGVIQPETTVVNQAPATGIPGMVDEPILTPKKKSSLGKKSAKAATVTLTMAGLLLLGAYVWQVNYPNLALKVASSKAGINASIPSYLPSGWQVSNNISSGPGTISYQIGSADGKASATVNESKTDWDSQALAENYVSNKSDKYLSLQAAGLTIYVYGNQASWVNNGTWYRIEGDNTSLSQDQLIRMATSL